MKIITRQSDLNFFTLLLFTLLSLMAAISFGQAIDSSSTRTISVDTLTQTQIQSGDYQEEDFTPGLFLFGLLAIVFMFICVGVGIVLAVIGLLILFGFVMLGILSTSIFVGLYNKSLAQGFKTFLVSVTAVGGLLVGAIGFGLFNKIVHWFTTPTSICIGSFAGLLTGFLLGLVLFYVLQKLIAFLKDKLKATGKILDER